MYDVQYIYNKTIIVNFKFHFRIDYFNVYNALSMNYGANAYKLGIVDYFAFSNFELNPIGTNDALIIANTYQLFLKE